MMSCTYSVPKRKAPKPGKTATTNGLSFHQLDSESDMTPVWSSNVMSCEALLCLAVTV